MPGKRLTALVLYHYLYPNEVISSILFSELSAGLAARGWRVIGSACNREWEHEERKLPPRLSWNGVDFRTVWRPGFRQSSGFGRMANAAWMIAAWSLMAFDWRVRPDVLIVGTDPILSPLVALTWRAVRPGVRVAHWCFDLYPEAAIEAGLLPEGGVVVRTLKRMLRWAYGRCGLLVDIGICMRRRLELYNVGTRRETITPWAMVEPEMPAPIDEIERQTLFGDAAIGLLYSGSFGLAHKWRGIAELATMLAPRGGKIVFRVQGRAATELRSVMQKAEAPVGFVPYATTESLRAKPGAADVYIVTLRESWTGTVVPSKFFGALAMGRPVLFLGSRDSAVARWIEEFQVGWVLTDDNLEAVTDDIVRSLRPECKATLFKRCHEVYRERFSREQAVDRWSELLRTIAVAG